MLLTKKKKVSKMRKSEKVGFKYKGKKIYINARRCGLFSFGLMFRSKSTSSCVFEFDKPSDFKLSSLFVFFPFVAIWLNKKNEVIGVKKISPFKLLIPFNKPYNKIIEIPINKRNERVAKFLVGS